LQGKGKTNDQALIKQLEETIATINSTKSHVNKRVTVLSGMLRDGTQSNQEQQSEGTELMFTMLDRYLKAGQTLSQIEESLVEVLTGRKNKF
jgi:hypothetical protein